MRKPWFARGKDEPGREQGVADPKPEPFVDKAPRDRFCDLVLTGGVTSGVIYPSVAVELARHYRFKNIAGTSAGAMAAALTAAAEYARRKGLTGRFEALSKVPTRLGLAEDVDGKGKTRLLSLFQPHRKTRRLFGLFLTLLNESEPGSGMRWFLWLAWALVKQYWSALILPLLLGFLLGYAITPGWLGVVVGACAFVTAGVLCFAARVYDDLNKGMVANGFGLCTGSQTGDSDKPALIDWLHQKIQDLAGKTEAEPLTFEDLWHVEPLPRWLEALVPVEKRKAIDLQIITANLTHGRPYRLPLDDEPTRLFFMKSEWATYFPASVMNYLLNDDVCPPYAPLDDSEPPACRSAENLRQLPKGKLPIVVAARLSLSFPFLFSAVPIWAIDFESSIKEDGSHERTLRRCWFSDGGVCSNFPIHLFDNFLPKWPTFGISLGRRSPFRRDERIWLPQFHNQGATDSWNRFDDKKSLSTGKDRSSLQRLVGFAMSIIATAKDWNDNTEMRMPGVRDRVVRVGFCDGEGELNVRLDSNEIERLARDYGTAAGKKIIETFVSQDQGSKTTQAWRDHRWVRFNALLQSMRDRVNTLALAAERTPYTQPLKAQISKAFAARALEGKRDHEAPLNAGQADALDGLLEALIDLEHQFERYGVKQPYRAEPKPSLRNRPP